MAVTSHPLLSIITSSRLSKTLFLPLLFWLCALSASVIITTMTIIVCPARPNNAPCQDLFGQGVRNRPS